MIRDKLQTMGVTLERGNVCLVCGEANEDCRHLFFQCSCVYKVWSNVDSLWGMQYVGSRGGVSQLRELVPYQALGPRTMSE